MRLSVVALGLMVGVLAAQAPGPPAAPWPDHGQPDAGWFCVPAGSAKDVETDPHACACRGMILEEPEPFCHVPSEDADGNQVMVPRGESSTCKVFCHVDHCKCGKRCEDT